MPRKVADPAQVAACWQRVLAWPARTVMTFHDVLGTAITHDARAALAAAVKESGQLAGYAGDVWFPQPPPNDHPWRTMPHHGMTSHISGTSLSAQARYAAIEDALGGVLCLSPVVLAMPSPPQLAAGVSSPHPYPDRRSRSCTGDEVG